ncbi:bifunctional helix-turn-helix transcriptional regulator/GNAT family N-acetyltransferase [Bdellovibrio bacteriovorus]|nr:bifunctional helix-turn-helix transcriptional regulator/GNAT family N-acetyltransferase [Bdellovibrio bacteriovorus]
MELFKRAGKMAMGTRVRFLSEQIGQDAAEIYRVYENDIQPKWFPVFYVLSNEEQNTVTSIAEAIGHSHASVSKILTEMSKAGLVLEKTDSQDRRRTKITLSKKGKDLSEKIERQYADVNEAIEQISAQATNNLWAAIEEWEYLLGQKSLLSRVLEIKKRRESMDVKIVAYQPKYKEAFYKLNEEWISKYFTMEKPDRDALENPESYILKKGGSIFVALLNGEPVGVCALIKREDLGCYELAKMAVSPKAQGKSIGFLLGQAIVEKAREMGEQRLFLESNTILKPAIRLYEKLGFVKVVGPPTPYDRCNIQMELKL